MHRRSTSQNGAKDPLKKNSFLYGVDLSMELVKPFIEIRKVSVLIKKKISVVTGNPPAAPPHSEVGPAMV